MDLESVNIIKENDSQAREDEQKLNKRVQVYKDTMTLIKLKMNKADTLIRQYNDKMKECDLLNEELSLIKNEKQDILKKYNLTMEKIAKLELINIDNKQSFEKYKDLADKQKIKLDENEKHINQLIFKIKNTEEQNLSLEDKVKTLEHDIKCSKLAVKTFEKKCHVKMKEQASQTTSLEKQDTSVITDPVIIVPKKVKMKDQNVMTDEFLRIEKEPFPIFCTKCEEHIIPTPVEQILKVMSLNPPFLSEHLSPPNSPILTKPSVEMNELPEANSTVPQNNNNPYLFQNEKDHNLVQATEESKHLTFMELDKLSRKMNKLENLIKRRKIKRKQNNCSRQNCCSAKNIKFILQLPNEDKFFEFRKRKKCKVKRLYQQYKKNILVKKGLKTNEWQIEDFSKPKKRKNISQVEAKLPNKKKKSNYENERELFECSEVIIPDVISTDFSNENIYKLRKSLSTSNFSDSVSVSTCSETIETNLNETEDVNMDESIPKLRTVSCNYATSQGSVSENIYQTSIETIQKENFVVGKVNETISDSNIHNLPIKSIERNKSKIASINNENQWGSLITSVSNDRHDIAEKMSLKNVPNVISQSIDKYKYDIVDETSEQKKNLESHKKFEENNLQNMLTLSVNVNAKDMEKSKHSSCNSKNQVSVSEIHESNKALNIKESISILNNNKKNYETENLNEDSNLSNKASISNFFSNTTHLSTNNNNKDVVNKKSEREENSVFHENNIVSNELVGTFLSEQLIPEHTILKNLHTVPETMKNIEKNKDTVIQSFDEIQQSNSFIEEPNSTISDISENDLIDNESSSSSDRSFSSTALEDEKCSNSDINTTESSEEKSIKSLSTGTCNKLNKNCKKNLTAANRKNLLLKIRNIRKNSKKPIILNKLEANTSQIKEKLDESDLSMELQNNSSVSTELPSNISTLESTPVLLLPKKQRIAHTPKSINDKSNKSNDNSMKIIKKTKSIVKSNVQETGEKISSIIGEFDKNFKGNVKNLSSDNPNFSTLNQENLLGNNNSVNLENENIADDFTNNVGSVEKSNKSSLSTVNLNTVSPQIILRKINENEMRTKFNDFHDDDLFIIENEPEDIDNVTKTPEKKMETEDDEDDSQHKIPIRELRSRQITINDKFVTTKKSKDKKLPRPSLINETNSCLLKTTVISFLNEFLSNPKELNKYYKNKIDMSKIKTNQKYSVEQLDLFMKAEEWTNEITVKTMENLTNSQELKYTAHFVIEYIANKIKDDESFDKSHTPPAPLLTKSEQKMVTLIFEIIKKYPEFSNIIIEGLQYKLFKFGDPQRVQILERLFRILVVINKIRKDREKVRIFCCDALYCLNMRAINIIHVALTCWPEILPKYDSNNDIMVKTIVHIIMSLQVKIPFPRLNSLKKLLFTYYNYPNSGYTPNNIKTEIMKNLKENAPGIKTAILLLCKKMGPSWTLENIIKELKQIIVTQAHPSLYEVLTLLGNILRCVPINTNFKEIFEIIDQLCDVLDSNTGSNDLQEGVVCCLISISKFKFEQIARFVLKWKFDQDIRPLTKKKLKFFFKCHDAKWWWKFIKNNFPPSKQDGL